MEGTQKTDWRLPFGSKRVQVQVDNDSMDFGTRFTCCCCCFSFSVYFFSFCIILYSSSPKAFFHDGELPLLRSSDCPPQYFFINTLQPVFTSLTFSSFFSNSLTRSCYLRHSCSVFSFPVFLFVSLLFRHTLS